MRTQERDGPDPAASLVPPRPIPEPEPLPDPDAPELIMLVAGLLALAVLGVVVWRKRRRPRGDENEKTPEAAPEVVRPRAAETLADVDRWLREVVSRRRGEAALAMTCEELLQEPLVNAGLDRSDAAGMRRLLARSLRFKFGGPGAADEALEAEDRSLLTRVESVVDVAGQAAGGSRPSPHVAESG